MRRRARESCEAGATSAGRISSDQGACVFLLMCGSGRFGTSCHSISNMPLEDNRVELSFGAKLAKTVFAVRGHAVEMAVRVPILSVTGERRAATGAERADLDGENRMLG